jgi:dihydroxyacetone kinase-like protein
MALTNDDLHAWIHRYTERVNEQREHLTKLDSAIGDGDHGQNLARGLQAAAERIDGAEDVASTMRAVAMALISKTGGASGPLYGTFFMDAGKATPDAPLTLDGWAHMMRAGLEGVQRRGKAEPGDKTMVDALLPAVEALETAAANGQDLKVALKEAAAQAKKGMEATTPMVAKKGRASYLGERSAGHQDPGATSSFYLFETAADALSSA